MPTITLTYKGTVKPAKTTHLSSEDIAIEYEGEIEVDDADKAIEKKIVKEFEKAMEGQLETQSAALDTWLKEKSAVIEKLSGLVDKLQKLGAPIGPAADEYTKLAKQIEQMAKSASLDTSVDELKKDYATIVADWAKNVQEQQPLIAAQVAVKNAGAKQWKDKKIRARAWKVGKAVLVVGVVILGVIACVASFGTATPAVAAIGAALVALGGITSLTRTAVDFKSVWNMEKRLLDSVEGEIKELAGILGKVQQITGSFAKRAGELRAYQKDREAKAKSLEIDLKKYRAELGGLTTRLGELEKADTGGTWKADIDKKKKAVADCQKRIDDTEAKLKDAGKGAESAKALFAWMEQLGVTVQKVTAVEPSTMAQNVKEYVTSADGLLDVTDMLAGVAGAALGVVS